MEHCDVAIVGGCAAGFAAASAIRERGDDRRIVLIDEEGRLPYKRTKVSKSFAAGFARDDFRLEEATWYRDNGVELLTGRRVRRIVPKGRAVLLDDGRSIGWDALILATGARPRRPTFDREIIERLHFPTTARAAERLRIEATGAESALVVGMGVLGVEVVDQLWRMGKRVTLLGRGGTVMPRELNETGFRRMEEILRAGDVELIFHEEVAEIALDGDRLLVTRARSGGMRAFDLVVYATGVEPETDLASAAGLNCERGVLVDERLRTSHPAILAAGDVAQHPGGRITHLWRQAVQQGRIAGLNAAGGAEPYRFVPFRLKCEIFDHYFFSVGRPAPDEVDSYEVAERTDGTRYLCAYYRAGVLAGLIMIGDKDRQKRYLQAVVEGWSRLRFEEEFL